MGRRRSGKKSNNKTAVLGKTTTSATCVAPKPTDSKPTVLKSTTMPTTEFEPKHTNSMFGHDTDDLIVIYWKYEDIYKDNKHNGMFFPQWFCTDLINDTHGVFIPTNQLILCTYEQMRDYGIKMMKSARIAGNFNNVKFYYTPTAIIINGQDPYIK